MRAAEVAAAAGSRAGLGVRLPVERHRLGGGGDRRDGGEDGNPAATGAVAPNAVNELDCNGWSAKYKTVKKLAGDLCTDPISIDGKAGRFIDNKWYVGHDEPSVKFISTTPGSGNTMTYLTKSPVDPRGRADSDRQRHQLRPAVRRALVRAADVRPELLPAEPVHPGQRHQLGLDQ